MAIRIQQYNTGPRRIGVGGIDPGYQQPRIGNIAATAENQLAGTVLEAGKALTNVAIKEYVSTETTRVSQSLLAMQKELSAERDRYMAENQGQNAIEAGQHFEKFARETAQKYFQEGGFSGRFAEMFNKQAAGTALHFTEQGQAYGRQQKAAWEESVLTGEIEDFQNLAAQNYNNPELIEFNRSALRERIENMRPGMDNRALLSRIDEGAAESIISGYLAHDDIKGARGALNEYRGLLGDKVNAVELQIRNRADALEAKARAEAERARVEAEKARNIRLAEYSYSLLENPDFQKSPGLAIEAIRSSGLPVEERFKVERAFSEAWNMQRLNDERIKDFSLNQRIETGKAELRAAETKSERDYILAQADPDAKPALLREATNLAQGFETPSDPVKFVQAKSEAGERNVSIETLSNKYGAYLTNADMATVLSIYDDKSLAMQQKEITRAFDVYAPMTGIDFAGAEGAARKAALKVTFANLCEERDARTQQDVEAVAYEFFSDRTKPGRLWDSTYSAPEAGELQAETGEVLPIQIPDTVRKFIKQEYALKGRPAPTEKEIQEAYRKNFGAFRGAIYE